MTDSIRRFILLNTLIYGLMLLSSCFGDWHHLPAALFAIIASFSYGLLLAGGIGLLGRLLHRALPTTLTRALLAGLAATVTLALFADLQIYQLYGFHINGFVINLVTTPGGLESMGASDGAILAVLGLGVVMALLQWALLSPRWQWGKQRLPRSLVWGMFTLMIGQQVAYGIAQITANNSILHVAEQIPLYQPTTFRSWAKRLGIPVERQAQLALSSGKLDYPLHTLTVTPPQKPLNIVWLTAESWRADMLSPEIMPKTWAFAQRHAIRFTEHYSGGNGTRIGMFTQFYGLPGSYWFDFLNARRSSVLIDQLQAQDYQLGLFTSSKFSYPEFDKTIFANVPNEQLHSDSAGEGWQRDRRNVERLLDFYEQRDPSRPFMSFMFFESPHARYYFPPESVIRPEYLEELNYATMDLERDIQLIFNRYINACHHLDSQFARVFDYLEQNQLLENTLVVVTGDHGEEFMESGRWGHNSEFNEVQIRVPLLLAIPGEEPRHYSQLSSHLDLLPMILPYLGVQNPASDYSEGVNLLAGQSRDNVILSDWSNVGLLEAGYKITLPINGSGGLGRRLVDLEDRPWQEGQPLPLVAQPQRLTELLKQLSRFYTTSAN